jgi:hypothetical protein
MGAPDLIQHLRSRGVTLTPRDDGNLSVRPKGVLTDDEREQIKAHKPELIAYLRQQHQPTLIDWTARARAHFGTAPIHPAPATEPAPPHVFNLPDSVRALLGLDDGEITRMVGYATQARRHGLNVDDAEEIADRLTLRDRQHDDRRMCIECRSLELSGRCATARVGQLAGADRRFEPVKTVLIRCAGFTPNTRTTP